MNFLFVQWKKERQKPWQTALEQTIHLKKMKETPWDIIPFYHY